VKPYVQDRDLTLYCGDALQVLSGLPSESVHMCVTSPPFFGLRDYGVEGQIGLEASPDEWVMRLVHVFWEVRRVLRRDGVLFVEVGDSYASNGPGGMDGSTLTKGGRQPRSNRDVPKPAPAGLKPKDLIGAPWLLAFALRADGWYLRSCIVWHKPNAMPESVTDRPTTAHSYVFLLSRSARYFYDAEAIREPAPWERWGDQTTPKHNGTETASGWLEPKSKTELHEKYVNPGNRTANGPASRAAKERQGADAKRRGFDQRLELAAGKNARSVWTIPTEGFPDAHFATFPQALVERCIKAGSPLGGTILDPFFGAGTTGLVARRLGHRCIGIDLSEAYCRMAAERLAQLSLLAEAT
jgi:DNA modification methylase